MAVVSAGPCPGRPGRVIWVPGAAQLKPVRAEYIREVGSDRTITYTIRFVYQVVASPLGCMPVGSTQVIVAQHHKGGDALKFSFCGTNQLVSQEARRLPALTIGESIWTSSPYRLTSTRLEGSLAASRKSIVSRFPVWLEQTWVDVQSKKLEVARFAAGGEDELRRRRPGVRRAARPRQCQARSRTLGSAGS